MSSKRIAIIASVVFLLLLTGCWNRRELGELAFVSAIGVDLVPGKDLLRVSYQIVIPSEVTSGPLGGGGGKNSPIVVYSETGSTMFEISRKVSPKVPRDMFFSHVRLVVIGESLARKGINDLFDELERSNEIRYTARVAIARGTTAENVISTLTPMEKIPANANVGKMDFSEKDWGHSLRVNYDDVINKLTTKESEPVISGLTKQGEARGDRMATLQDSKPSAITKNGGLAMFKNGKMLRWVEGDEAAGTVWLMNKMKSTVLNVDWEGKKAAVAIKVSRSRTKVEAQWREGKPVIHVSIKEEGDIREARIPVAIEDERVIARLEQALAEETRKKVWAALQLAQKEKTDIFGFGAAVNRADPQAWDQIKDNWNEMLPSTQIDLSIEAFIRQPGMITSPHHPEEGKK